MFIRHCLPFLLLNITNTDLERHFKNGPRPVPMLTTRSKKNAQVYSTSVFLNYNFQKVNKFF